MDIFCARSRAVVVITNVYACIVFHAGVHAGVRNLKYALKVTQVEVLLCKIISKY